MRIPTAPPVTTQTLPATADCDMARVSILIFHLQDWEPNSIEDYSQPHKNNGSQHCWFPLFLLLECLRKSDRNSTKQKDVRATPRNTACVHKPHPQTYCQHCQLQWKRRWPLKLWSKLLTYSLVAPSYRIPL